MNSFVRYYRIIKRCLRSQPINEVSLRRYKPVHLLVGLGDQNPTSRMAAAGRGSRSRSGRRRGFPQW
jgi:hypothetical protein